VTHASVLRGARGAGASGADMHRARLLAGRPSSASFVWFEKSELESAAVPSRAPGAKINGKLPGEPGYELAFAG
jgi:hypothetical protein